MLDERRTLLLAEKRLRWYSERGRGGIHWGGDLQTGRSPIDLVRKAVEAHPSYFTPALARLTELRDSLVDEIVNRIPVNWMSGVARAFAINIVLDNRRQLMELRK